MTFLLQTLATLLYTTRLRSFFQFPTITHITDLILFGCSCVFIKWFQTKVKIGTNDEGITEREQLMRVTANFIENIDFPFQYLFAAFGICIMARIGIIIQFNEVLGPLFKIVSKMSKDFLNFLILYTLITVTFLIVGNFNFKYELEEF